MTNFDELIGKTYGRWTVMGGERRQSTKPKAARQTLCKCECGTRRWVSVSALRIGKSTSCGCKSKEAHTRMLQRYAPIPSSFTEAA